MTHHAKEREDRPCPNGWTGCGVCNYEIDCRMGRYTGESAIEKAAAIAEEVMQKEAVESVEKIRGCKPYTDMNRFYAWRVQGLHYKPVIPLDGPSAPGGGSSPKRKKKPQKKQPEYLKTWGT